MRVSAESNAGKIAGVIAGLARDKEVCEIDAVGAGATYKAICAIAIANSFLEDEKTRLTSSITARKKVIGGVARRVISIRVEAVNGEVD